MRKKEWNVSKNKIPVLTDTWLSNRFELFEEFCFPSVQHQVNNNFTWLVFFDIETPAQYKEKIAGYRDLLPNFIPLYIDGMPAFLPSVCAEVKKASTPYIITSRIDNDDCISKHYIDAVQHQFNEQDYMAVDFIDGYTLQVEPQVKAGKRRQAYNPFISLIEKNDQPETVWQKDHASWKKEKNVLRIVDVRIWMSVIHFENKINRFVGYDSTELKTLFEEFIIDKVLREKLIKEQKKITGFNSIKNKLSSHWRTLYKDIKKTLGFYK